MNIVIKDEALQWFKKEISIPEGMGIKFYAKIYGSTNVHDNFTLGMSVATPSASPYFTYEDQGILFFVEENDDWFFSDYVLEVGYNAKLDEPSYTFLETTHSAH